MDLSTKFLGLHLKHPFVVGSSPLVYNLDTVKRLEDAGASAIVLHSLFEEQIQGDDSPLKQQADEFILKPDLYLERIRKIKETVSCPIIGSLNGLNEGNWISYSTEIANAGADALELNLYFLPGTDDESSAIVEQRAFQIVRMVKQFVTIPVAVKLSPFFTSLSHFVHRMEEAGAQGVVLFNRFFQPEINISERKLAADLSLSNPSELNLRIRWLAALYSRTRLNLAATGGVWTAEDAAKAIMAGADCVQVVSALLKHGTRHLKTLQEKLLQLMEKEGFESVDSMRGIMSYSKTEQADVAGRANYMRILQAWEK